MPSVSTNVHKDSDEAKREVSFFGSTSLRNRKDIRSRSATSTYSRKSQLLAPPSVVLLLSVLATVYLVLKCSVASIRHARHLSSSSGNPRFLSDKHSNVCSGGGPDEVFSETAPEHPGEAEDPLLEESKQSLIEEVDKMLATLDLSPGERRKLTPFQLVMVRGATRVLEEAVADFELQLQVLQNLTAALGVTKEAIQTETKAIGDSGSQTPELKVLVDDLADLQEKTTATKAALSDAEQKLVTIMAKDKSEEGPEKSGKTTKKKGRKKSSASSAESEEGDDAAARARAAAAAAVAVAERVRRAMELGADAPAGEEGGASSDLKGAVGGKEEGFRSGIKWFTQFFGDTPGRKGRKNVRSAMGTAGGPDPAEPSTETARRQRSLSAPSSRSQRLSSARGADGAGPEGPPVAPEGSRGRLTSSGSGAYDLPSSPPGASGSGARRRGRRVGMPSGSAAPVPPPRSAPPAIPMVLVTPLPKRFVSSEEEVQEQVNVMHLVTTTIMGLGVQGTADLKVLEVAFKEGVHAHAEADRMILSPSLPEDLRDAFYHTKHFTRLTLVSLYKTLAPVWGNKAMAQFAAMRDAGLAVRSERKRVGRWTPSSAKEALIAVIKKCSHEIKKAKIVRRNLDILFVMFPHAKELLMGVFTEGGRAMDKANASMVEAAMDCALLAEGVLKKRLKDSEKRSGDERARLLWFALKEGKELLDELRQNVDPLPVFNLELLLEKTQKMLDEIGKDTEDTEEAEETAETEQQPESSDIPEVH